MSRIWTQQIVGIAALCVCATLLACSDRAAVPADLSGVTDGPTVDDARTIKYDAPVKLDLGKCPPVPSCNWCGGNPKKNAYGCTVGFVCANGADPCTTPPCSTDAACKPAERCGKDRLCWPQPADGGPLKLDSSKVACPGAAQCSGSSAGDCSCEWSCNDGKTYKVYCKPAMGMYCKCLVNNVTKSNCNTTASGASACDKQQQCCGFPH